MIHIKAHSFRLPSTTTPSANQQQKQAKAELEFVTLSLRDA